MGKRLPEDVKQTCLWLAKGYQRRLQVYRDGSYTTGGRRNGKTKAAREVERMVAVEQALVAVGADIEVDELREQLRTAMMLNIESGRRYPYEKLQLDAISRSDFYRRKDKFLEDIATRMGLL